MSIKSTAKSLFLNRIDDHSPPGVAKGIILFGVMAIVIVVGFTAYLPTFVAALKEARIFLCIVYTLLYLLLILLIVLKPITFSTRAFLLCVIIFLIGVTSFYAAELMSSARLWFVCASLLACLLIGFRWALIFALVSLVFMVIYGLIGDFTLNMPQEPDQSIWVILLSTFILIQFIVLGAISFLMKALRQSETYYRSIFETSGSAMLIVEEDKTISLVNSNFAELSGYSKQELEGKKSWNDFAYPDDLERMKEYHYLRRQDPDAAPRQYELRFMTRCGEWRNLSFTADMIPGTNQSIGSGIDITERKQAEEALRESEKRYRKLINTSPDAIALVDVDEFGRFLTVNPAFAQRFGLTQEELEGKTYQEVMPKSLANKRIIDAKKSLNEEEIVCIEDEREGRYLQNYYVPIATSENQRTFQIISRDITEQKKAEGRIYYLAYYDELTALPNRRLFLDRLKQITARSEHFGEDGAVYLVDITRLREVNDTLGQQAGDELIQEVARRSRDTVHEEDPVARISGGEFMILSEGLETNDRARNLGLHILEGIGQKLELSGRLIYPEVKIGLTLFPQRGTDPDTLIKQASMALSEAKKGAHSIQEFAWQEDWISKQFHMEHDLKQALVNEEFFLCYQSQIDLRSGRIVGLEALLRWKHPQRGVISPGEFIPVLEQTGMIASADAWVIHTVCKQLKSWQESGIFVKASVNLSAQELGNDATIEVVRAALEENGVHPKNLEVEVTETSLMENVDQASRILQTLSSWGVMIALDDFGKGYSSMSYLQKLAINIIKIDKQFVDGLPENKDSVTIVQTIIAMAHNMGKEVLAEGVEREEQRQKLCELGCDYGQGFLWSRPQPAETLPFMGS